ncbi:MAG: hypothetical protein JXQ89_18395 [Pelagimonas sp.]
MGQNWILDVLVDLKTFARSNDMPTLAATLDDATFVAQVELASLAEGQQGGLFGRQSARGSADREARGL